MAYMKISAEHAEAIYPLFSVSRACCRVSRATYCALVARPRYFLAACLDYRP